MDDPFNLERFLDAQVSTYETALAELRAGSKRSHWMWFIFPQLRGLGHSDRAHFFGIGSIEEASAFYSDPTLGRRLRECVAALVKLPGTSAEEILGSIDALKLRSSLTLFRITAPAEPLFQRALEQYFDGQLDPQTIEMLEKGAD
jgi:uncharacterized protein (DUF1810 family)